MYLSIYVSFYVPLSAYSTGETLIHQDWIYSLYFKVQYMYMYMYMYKSLHVVS